MVRWRADSSPGLPQSRSAPVGRRRDRRRSAALRVPYIAHIAREMRWRPTHTIIALAVALAAVVTPIMVNRQLRRVYEQTLAQWLSKVTPPDRVIIGDSLAAGGGDFGRFGTINRGSTGLVTAQV